MCVITTMATIGAGIAAAASATVSAAATAAAAIGTAAAATATTVGSGLAAIGGALTSGLTAAGSAAATAGSAIASGASAVGSAAMSGLSAAGSAISSGASAIGGAVGLGGEAAAAGASTAASTTAEAASAAGLTTAEKIAAGFGIASGVAGAVTGVIEARQSEAAAKEAAAVQHQQAENERIRASQELDAGRQEAIDAARKSRQAKGTGRAQMAANGIMMDDAREGSAPAVYEGDMAAELAYDQAKIMHNAQLRAWGYQSNADALDRQANETLRAGRAKSRMGYVSAASSALSAGLSTYGGVKTLLT